jgi:hypothetical protein
VIAGRTTVGSYFGRIADLACDLVIVDPVSIYICPNPVRKTEKPPWHLHNRFGRVKTGEGPKAADTEFVHWIIIDVDPVTKGSRRGMNSTADEHQACQDLLRTILDAEPMIDRAAWFGSSGNGAYALVRVNLANTDETHAMVDGFLATLAKKYPSHGACVDDQWDATKKIGVPGSLKCKGPHSVERPRRVVTMERLGEPVEVFDLAAWLTANVVPSKPPIKPPMFHAPSGQTQLPATPRHGWTEDDLSEAREWLRNRAPAISGQYGRKDTFSTICVVMHGWDLSPQDTLTLISEWNVNNIPPWTERELSKTVDAAARTSPLQPRGFMRGRVRRRRNRWCWGNMEFGE